MGAPRMEDKRMCPYCRQWVSLPLRHPMQAFSAHKAECLQKQGAVAP